MTGSTPQPGPANPGLRNQAGARTFFRVAGCVLVPLGLAVCAYGFISFVRYDGWDGPPASSIICFLGGFLVFAVGGMFLNLGFGGVAARYGAGETMPVVRDSASYLSDGRGIMGVGRTVDDGSHAREATAAGPYCRSCGVRNDADARFCDSCGGSLA
ncbi:DUF7577 domain-containing protein [Nocardioides abyssi]|uniref:DUF7577 domain-containing protein n=1 Tax=Nocardioides abyssi TaxID=3058370 RepID=A0ABT8EPM7_9ACTN|nr:hypothetical protein [Nocardioides abyssi]MDN4159876.1 hypothetical protein [Nocardioides abyssi]